MQTAASRNVFFWPPAAILNPPSRAKHLAESRPSPTPTSSPLSLLWEEVDFRLGIPNCLTAAPGDLSGRLLSTTNQNSSRLLWLPVFFLYVIWLNVDHRKMELNRRQVIFVMSLYHKLNIDMD